MAHVRGIPELLPAVLLIVRANFKWGFPGHTRYECVDRLVGSHSLYLQDREVVLRGTGPREGHTGSATGSAAVCKSN